MKVKILETIIELLEKDANANQSDLSTLGTSIDLDEDNVIEIDDLSQQDQATDISDELLPIAENLDNTINIIKGYKAVSRNDCGPGALVETDDMYLLLGVTFPPLHIDKKKVVGVSMAAKNYSEIEGKKAGDTFILGNKTFSILSVV